MSLILDALRKSEAERRRGRMPDLHAELPPLVHATARPRRAWPWWFAGLAGLLAAAALAWSQWASLTVADTTQVPDAPGDMGRSAETDRLVASAGTGTAPKSTPPVIAPAVTPSRPATATSPHATHPKAHEAPTSPAADPMPSLAAMPVPARPVIDPPSPAAAPTVPRHDPAMEPASIAAAAPQVATAVPAAPSTPGTARLSDLSPGEREQLPALKISMHMWGPTPAQRFAIIDGTRVAQGDRVGEAVVVEIAVDGVVLNWHGRRLSLPLR